MNLIDVKANGVSWGTNFDCTADMIEEALNDADYYAEDHDYSTEDLMALALIASDFNISPAEVGENTVWFDRNRG